MKVKKEKNIAVFNKDIVNNAGYLYTRDNIYSSKIATAKQTEELVRILEFYFSKKSKILDIGCGDGKHTIELYRKFSPNLIVGIDPAQEAIKLAKKRINQNEQVLSSFTRNKKIEFMVGNIYNLDKLFKKNQFDIAIIRGVLHHLYKPEKAIRNLGKIFPAIIIIEANGYNPLLKIIEKTSPYHIEHEEKSYWPPRLNSWFKKAGYRVLTEKYFGIVPYFCPEYVARFLKSIEPFFENLPYLNRLYCACNYILYKK